MEEKAQTIRDSHLFVDFLIKAANHYEEVANKISIETDLEELVDELHDNNMYWGLCYYNTNLMKGRDYLKRCICNHAIKVFIDNGRYITTPPSLLNRPCYESKWIIRSIKESMQVRIAWCRQIIAYFKSKEDGKHTSD